MGADKELAPFCGIELDNALGPSCEAFCFCLGILFFVRRFSLLIAFSPAGKCSALVPVEKVNGALSRRQKRWPTIMLDSVTPQSLPPDQKAALLRDALTKLVRLTNGATFGGGSVTVLEADTVSTQFDWRVDEIAQFVKSTPEEKRNFEAAAMGDLGDPSVLYRQVDKFMNIGDGPDKICHRSKHTCAWIARPNVEGVHAWRGPEAMRDFLDLFGGSHPLTMVPSKTRPKSYMQLDELLREHEEVKQLAADYHHPTLLFKKDWANIKEEWESEPVGDLSTGKWEELCDKFRSDRKVVEHAIRYQLSLEAHTRASSELEKKQKASGLYEPALGYVARQSSGKSRTVKDIKEVLRRVHGYTASSLNGLHKTELLQKIIDAASIRPVERIDDALSRAAAAAAQAAQCAAAHVNAQDEAAISLVEREEPAVDSAPPPYQGQAPIEFRKRRLNAEEEDNDDDSDSDGMSDGGEEDDNNHSAPPTTAFPALKPRGLSIVKVEGGDDVLPAWVARHPASFDVDTTDGSAEFDVQWLRPLNNKYTGK